MSDRNWEAEMAKIDKQLASVSDDQLVADKKPVAQGKGGAAPVASATVPPARPSSAATGGTWKSWVKVIIAVSAAAGLMFWPWPARCGLPVMGFTAATGGVVLIGFWSAIGTWRHRLGLAHVASLMVMVWGMALGAREVLPRIGYAVPSIERPGQWSCDGLLPVPQPLPAAIPTPTESPTPVPTPPPAETPTTSPVTPDGIGPPPLSNGAVRS